MRRHHIPVLVWLALIEIAAGAIRTPRWLWSGGGRSATSNQEPGCTPCDAVPWVPMARSLPATYSAPNSPSLVFHLSTFGLLTLKQPASLLSAPPVSGPPSTNYGPPRPDQSAQASFGPPNQNQVHPPSNNYIQPSGIGYGPPKPDIAQQVNNYSPPKPNVGPPTNSYGPPKPDLGQPGSNYGPPSSDLGQSVSSYGPPKPDLSPPSNSYGAPKPNLGPPANSYGPPKPDFTGPEHTYVPPKTNIGPPANGYGPPAPVPPPSNNYGPPSPDPGSQGNTYAPPKPKFVSPSNNYGPPDSIPAHSQNYGPPRPPSENYGQPQPPSGHYISAGPSQHHSEATNHGPGPNLGPSNPPSVPLPNNYGPPKTDHSLPNNNFAHPTKQEFGKGYGPPSPVDMSSGPHGYLRPPPPPPPGLMGRVHPARYADSPPSLLTPPQLPFQLRSPHEGPPPQVVYVPDPAACSRCPSGPALGPAVEDARQEVGNFGDLPLAGDDSSPGASDTVTSSRHPSTEVTVTRSVPLHEFLSSVDFPVQIVQAPLLDVPDLPRYVDLNSAFHIPDSDQSPSQQATAVTNALSPRPFSSTTPSTTTTTPPPTTVSSTVSLFNSTRFPTKQPPRPFQAPSQQIIVPYVALAPARGRSAASTDIRTLLRQETDSVDPTRLQKNIDAWTAAGFASGATALPHDSKGIPSAYLTTPAADTHSPAASDVVPIVKGFAVFETEPDPLAKELVQPRSKPPEEPKKTWEDLQVSISPLTKEKVYVVTPLTSSEDSTPAPNRVTRHSEQQTSTTRSSVSTTVAPVTSSTTRNLIDNDIEVAAKVRYIGSNKQGKR